MRISDWSSDVCSSDLTFTRLRVDFDPPTMVLDDAEHDRQSQTRTLSDRLGREERFEHMLQRRLVHAATVITNRDRSDERRVGKQCCRTWNSRCTHDPKKKK